MVLNDFNGCRYPLCLAMSRLCRGTLAVDESTAGFAMTWQAAAVAYNEPLQ